MALTLLLLGLATAGGTMLTLVYDDEAGPLERLSQGALLGLLVLGTVGFALALAVRDLTPAVVVAAGLVTASPLAALAWASTRQRILRILRPARQATRDQREPGPVHAASPRAWVAIASFVLLGLLLLYVLRTAMVVRWDASHPWAPSIYTGVQNNLGDLPLHIAIIGGFVQGRNFPPEDPEFAGARLTYPFMADFLAAMLVRTGAGVDGALLLEGFLLMLATLGLLHAWVRRVTGSTRAALIAPWILLLSGGLGFALLGGEATTHPGGWLGLLRHLPHDYTISSAHGLRWGNALTALLIPQRSLLLGLPAFILVLDLWWRAVVRPGPETSRHQGLRLMGAAGVFTGLLPLGHTYTYLVLAGMATCELALFFRPRLWAAYAVPAIVLALPEIALLSSSTGVRAGHFLAFSPGWDHGNDGIAWFWLKNTGVLWPLVGAGLLWRGDPEESGNGDSRHGDWVRFYAPFLLCFLVPNIFRVSPWIWDGIKILVFWFVASVPMVALTLVRLGGVGKWGRVAAGALFVLLTMSGGLDLWRIVSGAGEQRVFGGHAVAFASRVSAVTPPGSVILHEPAYDSPVYLTGRRSLMGYAGHIWSRGLEGGPREKDVRSMLDGTPGAAGLLRSYDVRYCMWGPLEQKAHPGGAPYFARMRLVIDEEGYRLYEVPHE